MEAKQGKGTAAERYTVTKLYCIGELINFSIAYAMSSGWFNMSSGTLLNLFEPLRTSVQHSEPGLWGSFT